MITKEKKTQQVRDLEEKFARSKGLVFTEYKGLTVSEISELRRLLKEVGAEYKVVKNTLIDIAARGTPAESAREFFVGPTGIALGYDDAVATVKKALEFAEKNDKFKVKSGLVEGRVFTVADLKALSKLPPRDVLLSMLAGTFQAPMARLAAALNATVAQFAYALEGLKNKKSS